MTEMFKIVLPETTNVISFFEVFDVVGNPRKVDEGFEYTVKLKYDKDESNLKMIRFGKNGNKDNKV